MFASSVPGKEPSLDHVCSAGLQCPTPRVGHRVKMKSDRKIWPDPFSSRQVQGMCHQDGPAIEEGFFLMIWVTRMCFHDSNDHLILMYDSYDYSYSPFRLWGERINSPHLARGAGLLSCFCRKKTDQFGGILSYLSSGCSRASRWMRIRMMVMASKQRHSKMMRDASWQYHTWQWAVF